VKQLRDQKTDVAFAIENLLFLSCAYLLSGLFMRKLLINFYQRDEEGIVDLSHIIPSLVGQGNRWLFPNVGIRICSSSKELAGDFATCPCFEELSDLLYCEPDFLPMPQFELRCITKLVCDSQISNYARLLKMIQFLKRQLCIPSVSSFSRF